MHANPSAPSSPLLISFGIPTLNGGEDIRLVVASILDSGLDPSQLEIIISDNASTDEGLTQSVCEDLAQTHPQIRYYRHQTGLGWLPNWNFVLQQARGKYFMWLADDDQLIKEAVHQYLAFLEAHPDYTLVCGRVDYYQGDEWVRTEQGLSQEQETGTARVANYYWHVGDGALVYGLMRTALAQRIEHINCLGMDWHHVAAMAFQGKIKQFDFVGYNKMLGGGSSNFVKYAKAVGLAPFWGKLPTLRMALDVYREIVYRVPVYRTLTFPQRLWLAFRASMGITLPWYFYGYPKHLARKLFHRLKFKTKGDKVREAYNAS